MTVSAVGPVKRAASLRDLPARRRLGLDDPDEGSASTLVHIRVMTNDPTKFAEISKQVEKALREVNFEGVQIITTDENVIMETAKIKSFAQLVMPHIMHALGISGPNAPRI